MTRRIVGPFSRVEGELEVKLDIEHGRVSEAWVTSCLFRGFEQMLRGKDPADALVYVPRICGICSVSQSVAAAAALADVQGLAAPPNGVLARNLILGAENVADHLTHFYLYFMPDFVRSPYRRRAWFPAALRRFKALDGRAAGEVLAARAEFMHLMGLLAGKWPHSLALQPGGSTRAVEGQEQARILSILYGFRKFLEARLFGDALEHIVAFDSAAALQRWAGAKSPTGSDFRHFLAIADDARLHSLGRAADRFMSFGAYPLNGKRLFDAGIWDGSYADLDTAGLSEDVSHSWMHPQSEPKHPFDGVTLPLADKPDAYSWCKAPRLDGRVMEVGALARQMVNGHPLIRDLVSQSGGNVRNRVIARLLEVAQVVIAMESWARALRPREPFCHHAEKPIDAEGFGLVEAARGSLGHWLRVKNGRILNYQIIAPTTWNFSPRDAHAAPGALEQALVGAPVDDSDKEAVAVQHIVRSFDPCMVCTVH